MIHNEILIDQKKPVNYGCQGPGLFLAKVELAHKDILFSTNKLANSSKISVFCKL